MLGWLAGESLLRNPDDVTSNFELRTLGRRLAAFGGQRPRDGLHCLPL